MKIAIGNDHAGTSYKHFLVAQLENKGYTIHNHGTDSVDSVDYPDFIHPVAKAVTNQEVDLGIIICGSGNGAAMTANKYPEIRAALCWNTELAQLARAHNNANILSIPARFVDETTALDMVTTFIESNFEGGRHQRRIDKMSCI